MTRFFVDQNGNYYETLTDKEAPEGHAVAPQKPGQNYEWDGSVWVPTTPPPAFPTYEAASQAMVMWIDNLTARIEGRYPSAVKANWPAEEAMARAHVKGTATDAQTATLETDAAAKGRTPTEHAERIIANADAYRAISDQVRALWLATEAQLQDVTDPYDYEKVLEGAKAQATPLADAYGLA